MRNNISYKNFELLIYETTFYFKWPGLEPICKMTVFDIFSNYLDRDIFSLENTFFVCELASRDPLCCRRIYHDKTIYTYHYQVQKVWKL